MRFEPTAIPGLQAIMLERYQDDRGSFARLFCHEAFSAAGLVTDFVQQSLSVTARAGTIRGMHYQNPPYQEVKLVRCVRGVIYDAVVDLRRNSPTFLSWQAFELSPHSDLLLYIPEGCAHGFQALTDDAEVLYQMSANYAPAFADGFRYDDAAVGIRWPRPVTVIADKDLAWPPLELGEDYRQILDP